MGEDKKNTKCQCQKSDGTNYICGTNCVNKNNKVNSIEDKKYYSKYLRYKIKYLTLKSNLNFTVSKS